MSQRHKIVWYEGMNLDPHHFQQMDRYFKTGLDFRIHAIAHFDWGLSDSLHLL
jgi:type VI secretion system protein ImpJ